MSIRNVAILGGTGNLGKVVVRSLINAAFNVTVLSRSSATPASLPHQVSIKEVADFANVQELTAALRGQDAVVSTFGAPAMALQSHAINAAIDAGVKFFIPSEFGPDTARPSVAKLPQFKFKMEIQEQLRAAAEQRKITYALIATGPFFDMNLGIDYPVQVLGNKPTTIYDGGDIPFSTTTLADIAKAITGILQQPDEFSNRFVYVNSAIVTQNQLLGAAKKAAGSKGGSYEVEHTSTDAALQQAMEILRTGGGIPAARYGLLAKAIYDPACGNKFSQDDSQKLGIKLMSEAEVEALVKAVAEKKLAAAGRA